MRILGKVLRGLGVLAVVTFALFGFQAPAASAATGTVLADLTPPGLPGGVSVAFDGQYLYYTDLGGAVLHRMTPYGTPGTDIPILGGVAINAITYDATHDVFWGVDATGLNVYRIEKDGWAGLEFTIIPALDLPGSCNLLSGCSSTVSGLAYDASNDSLWYLPQGSQRVYHFNAAGMLLGYFDTNAGAGTVVPDCATNNVTGIAAGASVLYLTAGSCTRAFQYAKSDTGAGTKLSSFSVGGVQSAGAACDSVTFPSTTALWLRDAGNNHLRAIQIQSGSCVLGGGLPPVTSAGWMSGAGEAGVLDPLDRSVVLFPVQHAFHLLCAQFVASGAPNNMVINWKDLSGNKFSFHLDFVVTFQCFYDMTVQASPPPCDPMTNLSCFNTIVGEGLGHLAERSSGGVTLINRQCTNPFPPPNTVPDCGQVDFRFTDRGEPNLGTNRQNPTDPTQPVKFDDGEIQVSDLVQGVGVVAACGCIRANYQAHNQQ